MLVNLSVKDFLAKTAGNDPVPGGGSIAALNAAIASALTEMVANLTIGKKKYEDKEGLMKKIVAITENYRASFMKDIDADSEAYNNVFAAFKLPKETDEEKTERNNQIQEVTKIAAEIPMEVARKAVDIMDVITQVADQGNQNAITDACVAIMTARTAAISAILNVKINLSSIKDIEYVALMTQEANYLESEAIMKEQELLSRVSKIL
ncbi:cyclodeaminase/cyclohydrolase family protein [Dysgonomonas sp. Marseille-Q5470]|uniref:cyclodeaminase/cyclohydrolase family protein n=1 Tax=Dysgonomonas sp. Marseille-Q5470 TaxID=3039494 RepID=UPI0024BBF275|nr:cyclodeaminase/cyclohydrolase family protein [Dysgonomonas sp. Marseille-Q5470]MBS5978578.1 cyclodeaminase/cyclohydrolase family protein [Dysgonomonas mossii]